MEGTQKTRVDASNQTDGNAIQNEQIFDQVNDHNDTPIETKSAGVDDVPSTGTSRGQSSHDNGISVTDYANGSETTAIDNHTVNRNRRPSLVTGDALEPVEDKAIDQADTGLTAQVDENLPTLIGEKTREEIRSEMGLSSEQVNQFTPDKDQLLPESEKVEQVEEVQEFRHQVPEEDEEVQKDDEEVKKVHEVQKEVEHETVEPTFVAPINSGTPSATSNPVEETEKLPWDDEPTASQLPWETEDLPEEKQDTLVGSNTAEVFNKLPQEAKDLASDLPWDSNTRTALPWDEADENVQQEVVEPESVAESENFLEQQHFEQESQSQSIEQEINHPQEPVETVSEPPVPTAETAVESKESTYELPWESKEDLPELPWGSKESSVPVSTNQEQEPLPWEAPKAPVDTNASLEPEQSESFFTNLEEKVSHPVNSLDDLLADDDLLEDNTVIETKNDPVSVNEPQQANEPVSEFNNVNDATEQVHAKVEEQKDLGFLDDDLLMDDDLLLEAEPHKPKSQAPQNISPNKGHKHSYLPQAGTPYTYTPPPQFQPPQKPAAELDSKLYQAKKKNDAYDFPADLVPVDVKPAPRTHKYGPKSTASPSATSAFLSSPNGSGTPSMPPGKVASGSMPPPGITAPGNLPPGNVPSMPPGYAPSMPPMNQRSSKSPSLTPKPKKPFFEDLPLSMSQNEQKPARASAYPSVVRKNSGNSPNISRQSPQLHKPPMNPYAMVNQPSQSPSTGFSTPLPPTVKVLPVPGQQVHPGQPVHGAVHGVPRKVSNPTPSVNTNLVKTISGGSQTSPYVPTAGPYAPSSHNRAHSRTNSLIGGKGKEHNPYAPALPPVGSTHLVPGTTSPTGHRFPPVAPSNTVPGPGATSYPSGPGGYAPPAPVHPGVSAPGVAPVHPSVPGPGHNLPPARARGISNPKTGLYGRARAQSVKVQDPAALLKRQFPIFNWNNSNSVAVLVPAGVNSNFHSGAGNVQIRCASSLFNDKTITAEFPGPLTKGKGKKKELEKWIENNIGFLQSFNDPTKMPEILLNSFLAVLLKFDGDTKNKEFAQEISKVLNPTIDYNAPISDVLPSAGVSPNANKLDQTGVNHIFLLIQTGRIQEALSYTITKGDWALALILSTAVDQSTFHKVAADYARISYPFQKSNNKVHHMMPIVLKIFAGNGKAVIEDFKNVVNEGEWFASHWGELVATVMMNSNQSAFEFLYEFAKFLRSFGNTIGSECCYMLSGAPLSVGTSGNEFPYVGSFTSNPIYSEIYEYIVQLTPHTHQIPAHGFLHLLPMKLKHAQILADYGCLNESQKYGDYIGQTLKNVGRNAFFTPESLSEFQKLMVRISDAESSESSWFGSKISKVNLDKMWGHLDKFIGGEELKPNSENGVFSKFSPSVSRVGSVLDFTATNGTYNQKSPQTNQEGFKDPIQSMPISSNGLETYGRNASYSKHSHFAPSSSRSQSLQGQQIQALQGQQIQALQGQPIGQPIQSLQGSIQPPLRTPMSENHDSNSVFTGSPGPFAPPSHPYANSRYAPSNSSSEMINDASSQAFTPSTGPTVPSSAIPPPLKRSASKYAPGGANAIPSQRVPYNKPYQNLAGNVSSSSVGSYGPSSVAPNMPPTAPAAPTAPPASGVSNPNFQGSSTNSAVVGSPLALPNVISQNNQKRPSISSILSTENFVNRTNNHSHSHSPSIQSDISLDYPSEFRAGRRESELNDVSGSPRLARVTPIEEHTEVIDPEASQMATSQSTLKSSGTDLKNQQQQQEHQEQQHQYQEQQQQEPEEIQEHKSDRHEEPEATPSKPPSQSVPAPPASGPKPGPPKGKPARPRTNPYAPGGVARKPSSSKYSSGNKYSNPNAGGSQYVVPQMSSGDMFKFNYETPASNKSDAANSPEKLQDSAPIVPAYSQDRAPTVAPSHGQQDNAPQEDKKPVPSNVDTSPSNIDASPGSDYKPPKLFRPTNVDDSFELPDSSELETPKPRAPLMLNKSPGRESMFTPYHGDTSLRKPSAFGIDSTFNEFPIPGSPDVTTRANSVINGMGGGLFSSRLSQSQQSAMYQQYEVQDDTVHDYVPVVEEEDDSDDERASKRKKEDERRKLKAAQARGHGQQNGRWLSWLNKGDDKPKPIRAKLGEQNKFVYDEKLKRWINKDIPIEDQMGPAAPPPPPKKKVATRPGPSGPAPNRLPSGPGPSPMGGQPPVGPGPVGPIHTPARTPGQSKIESTGGAPPSGPVATSSPTNTPAGSDSTISKPAPAATPKPANLATAGLDDLLSLGGSTASVSSTRKTKRGARRNYVNVFEQ